MLCIGHGHNGEGRASDDDQCKHQTQRSILIAGIDMILCSVFVSDMYKVQLVQFVRRMKSPEFRENIERSLEAERV